MQGHPGHLVKMGLWEGYTKSNKTKQEHDVCGRNASVRENKGFA